MKPHPHAELIKAWADGAEIEVKVRIGHEEEYGKEKWWPAGDDVSWDKNFEYRIKPQPNPKDIEYTTHIEYDFGWKWVSTTSTKYPNLKLTFDGETGKLKSSEVL